MREKDVFEKQRECDKRYIRRLKKPKVKKNRCYSESEIESEPEAYHNYGYDESERKALPPKKKIKRDRCNLFDEENNTEREENEEEDESESENDNRKIKKQKKQNKPPPNKKTKNVKTKKGITDHINK